MLISPSQISTFRDCPRKWAFDKIDKVPRKSTPATQFGTDAHLAMELYGREGSKPNFAMATAPERAALKVIEGEQVLSQVEGILYEGRDMHGVPGPSSDATGKFSLSIEGKPYNLHGYLDYIDPRDESHVIITDYKFLKDDKWIKSTEQLAVDPQALIYSYYAFSVWAAEQVTFSHEVGVKKKQPYRRRTSITFGRNDAKFWAGMQKIFDTCDDIYAAKQAMQFEKNTSACFMYGGCTYKALCKPPYKRTGGTDVTIIRRRK